MNPEVTTENIERLQQQLEDLDAEILRLFGITISPKWIIPDPDLEMDEGL